MVGRLTLRSCSTGTWSCREYKHADDDHPGLVLCRVHTFRRGVVMTRLVVSAGLHHWIQISASWVQGLGQQLRLAEFLVGDLQLRLADLLSGDSVGLPVSQTCSVGYCSIAPLRGLAWQGLGRLGGYRTHFGTPIPRYPTPSLGEKKR